MDPKFSDPAIPRYTQKPLPGYRHLPFQNPHPFLDEDGHSYGETLHAPESFGPDNWRDCSDYLYSIDLFNRGYWWEAHERLKQLSIAAGRDTQTGRFIQGLIQVAAALLKHFMRQEQAAATLAEMGLKNLQIDEKSYLGIEIAPLVSELRDCIKSAESDYPGIRLTGFTG